MESIDFWKREIEVVDGESIEGVYFFLACSNGNEIENERGLTSRECFDFLISQQKNNNILTIFGINYDVNQWINSFSRAYLERFYNDARSFRPIKIRFNGENYFVSYLDNKKFSVTKKLGGTAVIWETFSFFQESFAKVLEKNLPSAKEYLEKIQEMKNKRSEFSSKDKEEIKNYCRLEVKFHKKIMNDFFSRIRELKIELKNMYSPASIAKNFFVKHDIARGMEERNFQELNNSYYGGRFELIKFGKTEKKIYEYDINSAYPYAMQFLRSSRGEWKKEKKIKDEYSLVELTWKFPKDLPFFPFPFRANNTIIFPSIGRSFVRGVEFFSGLKFQKKFGGKIKIENIWNFHRRERDERKFFLWIKDLYEERKKLKEQGNGNEKILKLVINSAYGALAQLHPKKGKFFQMEWASWITAKTRSMVLEAGLESPESIISFATDSVVSTRKLSLPVGDNLGEWTAEEYDGIISVQSGLYWLKKGGEWKTRTRGFTSREITREKVLEAWSRRETRLVIPCVRFCSLSKAIIEERFNEWRKWITVKKEVDIMGNSEKRKNIAREFPKNSLIFLTPVSNFEYEYQIFKEEIGTENEYFNDLEGVVL